MRSVSTVEFKPGSKEELLPNFDPDFPYIATCSDLRSGCIAPWHWHQAVELFYVERGCLEYFTPSGRHVFPSGSGGFINTNIPHMTIAHNVQSADRELLHLFDPVLISGHPGSVIDKKYVLPLTSAAQTEMIALHPEHPRQDRLLQLIRDSFQVSPNTAGFELRIRAALSEIWLELADIAATSIARKTGAARTSEQIRQMMIYVHEHYTQKLSVTDLAEAACISERLCFNLFQNHLHMTPMEYVKNYRLQAACKMLAQTGDPISDIAAACGLGSSSYFSRIFHEKTGCSPLQYRNRCAAAQDQT